MFLHPIKITSDHLFDISQEAMLILVNLSRSFGTVGSVVPLRYFGIFNSFINQHHHQNTLLGAFILVVASRRGSTSGQLPVSVVLAAIRPTLRPRPLGKSIAAISFLIRGFVNRYLSSCLLRRRKTRPTPLPPIRQSARPRCFFHCPASGSRIFSVEL